MKIEIIGLDGLKEWFEEDREWIERENPKWAKKCEENIKYLEEVNGTAIVYFKDYVKILSIVTDMTNGEYEIYNLGTTIEIKQKVVPKGTIFLSSSSEVVRIVRKLPLIGVSIC